MFYSVWVLISTINYSYTKAYDAVGLNLSFKLPEKKPFFDGLDLDGGNWQPGHLLKSDDSDWENMESESKKVEMVYLWNEDKTEAIGVIRNRTMNYRTFPEFPDIPSLTDSDISNDECTGIPHYADIAPGGTGGSPWNNNLEFPYLIFEEIEYGGENKLKIKGMQTGGYTFTYYDINSPESELVDSESSDNGPNVKVEFPNLIAPRSVIAFRMKKNKTKSSVSSEEVDSSEGVEIDEEQAVSMMEEEFTIYPNPSNGSLSLLLKCPGFYRVYSINGEVIIDQTVARQGNNTITIPDDKKGVFIISIIVNDEVFNEKIIIK